jgi:hypothetical protein
VTRAIVFVLGLAALGAGAVLGIAPEEEFPHEEHAGLFPLCAGCHEGVGEGDRARFFPAPEVCAGCHNGVEQKRVTWDGAEPYASNLDFSHPEHEQEQPLDCTACHTRAGQSRMAVQRVVTEQCFACHAHPAQNHFVDAQCQQCHVPLARTAFTAQRVASLPEPPSHDAPNFLERVHGELARSERARCEACHTRERCAACHVDAATNTEVKAMSPAGPQLKLPGFTARYSLPASHRSPSWIERHGQPAQQNIGDCAACHTRETCAGCHAGQTPRVIRSLPSRQAVAAPGVTVARRTPPSHAAPFFDQKHGTLAAVSQQSCSGCHARTECEACHSAAGAARISASNSAATLAKASGVQDTSRRRPPVRRLKAAYHPANFMTRHASAAYNRNLECSNCHDTSRFCRDCHESAGMGTVGRLQAGFHDAQPAFLLNHGKPARQALESCASCHKQTDCMQCHSSLGAFRVNPHGPSFDARRVQQRNARLCFACHLTDPLGGNRE